MKLLNSGVLFVIKKLRDAGYKSYLSGSCAREFIVGDVPRFWEISTNASTLTLTETFANNPNITVRMGDGPGVSKIKTPLIEANIVCMHENVYKNNKLYGTKFTSDLKVDAARRDFTFDAMYFDPINRLLHDPYRGLEDLRLNRVRCTGNANTKIKNNFRVALRAVQIAANHDLSLDPDLTKAIYSNSNLVSSLPIESFRDEFCRSITAEGITNLMYYGIIDEVIPELMTTMSHEFKTTDKYGSISLFDHTIQVLDQLEEDDSVALRLAALFHDISYAATEDCSDHAAASAIMAHQICKRIKLPDLICEKVGNIIMNHDKAHGFNQMSYYEKIKFMRKPEINDIIRLQHMDAVCFDESKSNYLAFDNFYKLHKTVIYEKRIITPEFLTERGYAVEDHERIIKAAEESQMDKIFNSMVGANLWLKGRYPKPQENKQETKQTNLLASSRAFKGIGS